ncbi:MAG: hypothetical protein HRU03_06855 [Nanoarchaeales archaeon]|nr:hypothetical protein [Nanoarchaeales archaeon]
MDYLKKILEKGVIIGVNSNEHKLDEKYLSKLNKKELNEVEKLYSLCEKLNNEYFRLTKENQKVFDNINKELIKVLDKQINLSIHASREDFEKINLEMKTLEKKYKKLEETIGLDLVKDELMDCVERINCYFLQAENLVEKSLLAKNPCY